MELSPCMYCPYMQEIESDSEIKTYSSSQWTVKEIFEIDHNWDCYKLTHKDELRSVEIAEVEKMLGCNDASRGYFIYHCQNCGLFLHIGFGCRSRLCSCCGKHYTDQWADKLPNKMFDVSHRHIVMGVPPSLWAIMEADRSFWKIFMDSAISTFNEVLSRKKRNDLRVGAIIVLHPYSRDLSFKPHLHLLVTEGGFDGNGIFVSEYFFPAKLMRMTWQRNVLEGFKKALPATEYNRRFIKGFYERYSEGFYVYLPAECRIRNRREISAYVARYVRHPAIANSRISGYDGKYVYYWYVDNNNNRHDCNMEVFDFIKAIIRHIPEKRFKMIRYYGAYARGLKGRYADYLIKQYDQQSIIQRTLDDFNRSRKVYCPNCGHLMEFIVWLDKPPPYSPENRFEFSEHITDWTWLAQRMPA